MKDYSSLIVAENWNLKLGFWVLLHCLLVPGFGLFCVRFCLSVC